MNNLAASGGGYVPKGFKMSVCLQPEALSLRPSHALLLPRTFMKNFFLLFRKALWQSLDHDVMNTAKASAYSGMLMMFPALLVLTTLPGLFQPRAAMNLSDAIMAVMLIVFAVRLAKTKKFMPSGMLFLLTVVALACRNLG